MDVQDYRAARHRRLVEIAIELGVPADGAAAVVDRVIEDQRRRIARSADPDEVVVPALREAVLGGRSRGPSLAVAALVAVVAAAFAVTVLAGPPDREEVERRVATVPSLVGLTSTEAVSALGRAGIETRVDPVPQCDPAGQVLGSVPPSGDTVRPDEVVTVIATATPTWSCPADAAGRAQAWAFLRFLVSGSGRPRLAPEVRLYVDGAGGGHGRRDPAGHLARLALARARPRRGLGGAPRGQRPRAAGRLDHAGTTAAHHVRTPHAEAVRRAAAPTRVVLTTDGAGRATERSRRAS